MATGVRKFRSLLPYPQMILKAIEALKEEDGVNRSAISKYMESIYENLPAGHSKFLSDHLNRMKDCGQLVFWKNKYSKPNLNASPKRGRGRPRKSKHSNVVPISLKVKTLCGSKKRRGRPRKMARSMEGFGTSTLTSARKAIGSGRPRGRPPKVKPALSESADRNLKLEGKANRDCTKVAKGASFSSIMKNGKYQTAAVRRSDRITNIFKPVTEVDAEPVIEEIIMTGSDEEESQESIDEEDQEDEQHAHMQKQEPQPSLCEKNMEEKINYIIESLESLEDSVETLNMKIEFLREENHELSMRLEGALATLEIYGKIKREPGIACDKTNRGNRCKM
ncbi:hypothetical protein FNV43_RR24695 [Rhamnella rubrinervis]|uniref:H15 domain-containing protein n=1 Tax=Rhamnella rubrinervis TaxID=2594499 RepID=A0A8K0DSW9_9ROSA|nr:hypothetical protein FNV43_RR24695 [Rhamnella rubrinervis]